MQHAELALDGVSEPWRRALEQAWLAYLDGTIPVGAAVADPDGRVAAEGRNRIFGSGESTPAGQLAGTWLAHAEVNAIAQLVPPESTTERDGWTIYTTLEPCPMCIGAITVAFRDRITVAYAVADRVGGALTAADTTSLGQRRRWRFERLTGPLANFVELLTAFHAVELRPSSSWAHAYASPEWSSLFSRAGPVLAAARDDGRPLASVLEQIGDRLVDGDGSAA